VHGPPRDVGRTRPVWWARPRRDEFPPRARSRAAPARGRRELELTTPPAPHRSGCRSSGCAGCVSIETLLNRDRGDGARSLGVADLD
jgi:hypothetical protein